MINLGVFCPFERIAQVAKTLSSSNVNISVEFDGFGIRNCFQSQEVDENFGFSIEQRLKAMKQDVISGKIRTKNESVERVYNFTCLNELTTDTPAQKTVSVNGKQVFNGRLSDGSTIAYPEAVVTTALGLQALKNVYKDDCIAGERAFYQYVFSHMIDDNIIIYGPSNKFFSLAVIGELTHGSKVYAMLGEANDHYAETIATVINDEEETVSKLNRQNVILINGTSRIPFVFGQAMPTINGKPLKGESVFNLLALCVFFENKDYVSLEVNLNNTGIVIKDDIIEVNLRNHAGFFELAPDVTDFITEYVLPQSFVAEVMDGLFYKQDQLLISVDDGSKRGYGVVTGRSTTSCFALALSKLLSMSFGCTITSMLLILKALSEQGHVILDGLEVSGNTSSSMMKKSAEIQISHPLINGTKIEVQRFDRAICDEVLNKYCLVGFGYPDNTYDLDPNAPDHYVVGEVVNGRVYCAYDPLRSKPIPVGTDLTPYRVQAPAEFSLLEFVGKAHSNHQTAALGGDTYIG